MLGAWKGHMRPYNVPASATQIAPPKDHSMYRNPSGFDVGGPKTYGMGEFTFGGDPLADAKDTAYRASLGVAAEMSRERTRVFEETYRDVGVHALTESELAQSLGKSTIEKAAGQAKTVGLVAAAAAAFFYPRFALAIGAGYLWWSRG